MTAQQAFAQSNTIRSTPNGTYAGKLDPATDLVEVFINGKFYCQAPAEIFPQVCGLADKLGNYWEPVFTPTPTIQPSTPSTTPSTTPQAPSATL